MEKYIYMEGGKIIWTQTNNLKTNQEHIHKVRLCVSVC